MYKIKIYLKINLFKSTTNNTNYCTIKMEEYLTSTINKLNTNNYSQLNLVMGNESCDLDSAVSALVYATFLDWQHNQLKCKSKRDERVPYKDDIFVPILNVAREDFDLKTEVAFLFKKNGINKDVLVFRDDHNLRELVTTTKTNVRLVDHHVLSKNDDFLSTYVTEVIDHRPIDKCGWSYKEDTRSTIEIVGSCATLIAQRIKDLSDLMSKGVDFFKSYLVCCDMLHSTIILDTVNFSKEVDKATAHDIQITHFLEEMLQLADIENDRKSKLDSLVEARRDVSTLSHSQLLRKDVKIIADVIIPSFPILVEEFLQTPGASQAVNEALTREKCTLALLLGMSLRDGLRRDAAVFSPDPEKAAMFAKLLTECKCPCLQLHPYTTPAPDFVCFRQHNLSASRKQYIPIVNDFVKTCK